MAYAVEGILIVMEFVCLGLIKVKFCEEKQGLDRCLLL